MRTSATNAFRTCVGGALRRRRLELGLSQEALAWSVEVTQGSISNYELGRSDIPLSVLVRVCEALEIDPVRVVPPLAALYDDE